MTSMTDEDLYWFKFNSVACCLLLAITYVLSLYIWSYKEDEREEDTVKKRFCSVFVVSAIAPFVTYQFLSSNLLSKYTTLEILGLRLDGIFLAIIVPFLHTALLFMGPLFVEFFESREENIYLSKESWRQTFSNIFWWRNQVVAPLSEEFAYRSCMMPLLLQALPASTAILVNPLLFGVAHLHHMYKRLRNGHELKVVLIVSLFQFSYTTIFGAYSAYLFTKTGHFAAPFVAHALCNHMGFPEVHKLLEMTFTKRAIYIVIYILGLSGWILTLPYLFDPSFYSNNIDWNITVTPRVAIS